MSTLYDYRWHQEGRYIAILQRSIDSVYDPYLSLADDLFITPSVSDSSAVYLRYTVTQTAPSSETVDLGLSQNLSLAVVHYVKARLAEEKEDFKWQFYHTSQFYKYLSRDQMNKKGGPRVVLPKHSGQVIKTTFGE